MFHEDVTIAGMTSQHTAHANIHLLSVDPIDVKHRSTGVYT